MPKGSPLHMTIDEANAIPDFEELRQPQLFKKGSIEATIKPQMLAARRYRRAAYDPR